MGRCPGCGEWNCLVEEMQAPPQVRSDAAGERRAVSASPLSGITSSASRRTSTGTGELDAVLGGGIVPGSAVLVGGDPGIGKSTMLLQVGGNLSRAGGRVLYVSAGEAIKELS